MVNGCGKTRSGRTEETSRVFTPVVAATDITLLQHFLCVESTLDSSCHSASTREPHLNLDDLAATTSIRIA